MEDIQKVIPAKDISWSNYPYCSFDDSSNNQDIIDSGNAEIERMGSENEEEKSEEENEEEKSEEEYEEEKSEEEYEEEIEEERTCIEIIDVEEENGVIIGK